MLHIVLLADVLFLASVMLGTQTPKHIRGGWSHNTDTSKPVDGKMGALNGQSVFQTCNLLISDPMRLPTVLNFVSL
jgi:hypothetical protein